MRPAEKQTEQTLLNSGSSAASNGRRETVGRETVVGLTALLTMLVVLDVVYAVVGTESRKRPAGLSTDTPAPNTSVPSTLAPKPANTSAPSTLAPKPANTSAPSTLAPKPANTSAPSTLSPGTLAPVSPTSSVEFTANQTMVEYSCEQPVFLDESWVSSETCTEILAADTLPGRAPSSDPTFNSILSIAAGGGIGPNCTLEQWCNPIAEISCDIMPASGILIYSTPGYCEGYNDLGSSSGRGDYCVDGSKLPCLMDPTVEMFKRVVNACKEVKKGNMTAVCGQDGGGSTLFNTTQYLADSCGNATITNTGFFSCRDKGRSVQRSNPETKSKYPRNMPLRANNHR